MYISANHINIKLNQDCSDFLINEELNSIILCDGIGEFEKSGKYSELVCEIMIENKYTSLNELFKSEKILNLKETKIEGGTTILFASTKNNIELTIEYLGNGGCIQLSGSFAKNQNNLLPYRFNNLILPHVSYNGNLTRFISHNSNEKEHNQGQLQLILNNTHGDLLIFFTDGINSLEENVIINDNEGRYWRIESIAIQFVLDRLHIFLVNNNHSEDFQEELQKFNQNILQELKDNKLLEDDASIAFIITDDVLNYYKVKND